MVKKWKIFSVIGLTGILFAGYTWGVPAAINISGRKIFIEQTVFEKTGIKLDIGNPKISMGVFPSIWAQSDNISVINPDNSKALSIDNPRLKLKLFPLLFKKVEFSQIFADSEEVHLTLTKDNKIKLGNYPLEFERKDNKFYLAKLKMNLGRYNILLNDEASGQKLFLNGEYFSNGIYKANKDIRFATKGIINANKQKSDYYADIYVKLPLNDFREDKFKINADISNFELLSISNYIKFLSNGIINDISGTIDIHFKTNDTSRGHKKTESTVRIKNLKIDGVDKVESMYYKDEINLGINFETVNGGFDFKNSYLKLNNSKVDINGKITGIGEKVPNFEHFTINVPKAEAKELVQVLPWARNLVREMNFYKIKQYGFYGNGYGNLRFEGRGRYPKVYGNFKIEDVYLLHKIKGAPENADVDMKFHDDIMDIKVYVPTAPNQNVTVKGFAKIDGSKYSELNIKSTDSINLAQAMEILNPLHEILKFKLGPIPMMTLSGIGSIELRSAGKKIDPHLFGWVKFHDATASFNDIHYLTMRNASGEVLFQDTKIPFKTYNATLNGQPLEIKGDSSVLGDVNVVAKSNNQDIPSILKIINSSPDLAEVQRVIKPFTNPSGRADVNLNIYGVAKDVEHIEFNKDLFAKGTIVFHNAQTTLKDTYLPLKNINGKVNFDKKQADYDVTGFVRNSKIHVAGTADDNQMDLTAVSDKTKVGDCFDLFYPQMKLPYKKQISEFDVNFVGKYKGIADSDNLDYSKIKVDGSILPNLSTTNPIKLREGAKFSIANSNLTSNNLKGTFYNTPFTLSFTSSNIYDEVSISSAKFDFQDFNLESVNDIKNDIDLPVKMASELDNIQDIKGLVDVKGYIKNGLIYSDTDINNISFIYKPADVLVKILNGKANIRANNLYLENVNSRISSMPVFLRGRINNIVKNPYLDIYVNAKPNQMFFDRFFNSKSVYPIKVKGDASVIAKITGVLDKLYVNTTLNLDENSSIYYMGATLSGAPTGAISEGQMVTNPISVNANTIVTPNKIHVKALDYNQTITSQNKKPYVQKQLTAYGDISVLNNNNLRFDNFKIKTLEPTSAQIFNILLKKPTIKQGVFTTDLTLNGVTPLPKINGFLNISSIDIPLLDATIRDVNLDFTPEFIIINSKGIFLTSDVDFNAKVVNGAFPPIIVEEANLDAETMNLNRIMEAIEDFETNRTRTVKTPNSSDSSVVMSPTDIIIKNAKIKADRILIKKAQATNFNANLNITPEHILNVENYDFNLANGKINGNIKYNLNTSDISTTAKIDGTESSIIAEDFFDMSNQIYGKINADINASCNGANADDCLKTLDGNIVFSILNGKMPKLGSLEYLLKAGNLLTGGVTALSINGVIDVITPLKTGNFDSIKGDITVKDGIADNINVYSSGKDLNLYMTGNYDIPNLVADLSVYGSLSKNFSTILGKIGNMSLNRLFNKIPGVSINEINPKSTSDINKIPNFDKNSVLRVFKAEIFGDINGENYVRSFKWIRH